MRSSTPDHDTHGGEIVVEAPTATRALEEVSQRLGPRATIVEASKVSRGGIGGFFAREMVQLRAQPGDVARMHQGAVTTTAGGQTALERLLADLSSEVNQREETFGETLRRHLAVTEEPAPAPTPEPAPTPQPAPAPAPEPEPERAPVPLADGSMAFDRALAAVRLGTGRPASRGAPPPGAGLWSADRMMRLGVPAVLLAGWEDPPGDLEGLVAFAERVAPLCGPLPHGPSLLAGPRADRLGAGLGAAAVARGGEVPQAGPACARVRDSDRDRAWLEAARRGRWLHLVVGGGSWQRLLLDGPAAVSWHSDDALPDALRVAAELGLPLGYGCGGRLAGAVVAAGPVDVAVTVRDLLARP